jgi:hypothetical protein
MFGRGKILLVLALLVAAPAAAAAQTAPRRPPLNRSRRSHSPFRRSPASRS